MAFNPNNKEWTIKTNPDETQSVEVLFGCDNKVQKVYLSDVSNVDNIRNYLDNYTLAYIDNHNDSAKPDETFDDLLNKTQTVDTPDDTEQPDGEPVDQTEDSPPKRSFLKNIFNR